MLFGKRERWRSGASRPTNHKDCETWLLYGVQKGCKVEVQHNLWALRQHVGRVKVIPDTIKLAECYKMVNWIANVSLLRTIIFNRLLYILFLYWQALYITEIFKCLFEYLYWEIAIISYVLWPILHVFEEVFAIWASLINNRLFNLVVYIAI